MKKIFLDEIDKKFNSTQDVALGPWCLEKHYNFLKICEIEKSIKIIKKGKHSRSSLIKLRESIYKKNFREIIKYLTKVNKDRHNFYINKEVSKKWILSFISLLMFVQDLVDQCLSKYKKNKIEIIMNYKPISLRCKNTEDFEFKMYSKIYLATFFLYLLKMQKPKNWKITYLKKEVSYKDEKFLYGRSTFKGSNKPFWKIKNRIKNYLLPNFLDIYGFTIFERLILSMYLRFKTPIKKSYSIENISSKVVGKINSKIKIPKNFFEISKDFIPSSLKNLETVKKSKSSFGKIIVTSGGPLIFNDKEKLKLFHHKDNGGLIFSQQHGQNYNEIDDNINVILEMSYDGLLSWGYKTHPCFKGKIYPLASPLLEEKKENNSFENKIIFCSTNNHYFDPLYSSKDFSFVKKRILNTFTFLKYLKKNISKNLYYKTHERGHFSEKEIIKKKYKLNFTNQIPESYLGKVKLMMFNNLSTAFYKALAANQPVISVINNYDLYNPKLKETFKILEKNKIIFRDPIKAANFVNKNYHNFQNHWCSPGVQKTRKKFCNQNALVSKKTFKEWMNFFIKLK